jgi:hypothetical protein
MTGNQLPLKLDATHSRHTHIQYQAVRTSKLIRSQKLFG